MIKRSCNNRGGLWKRRCTVHYIHCTSLNSSEIASQIYIKFLKHDLPSVNMCWIPLMSLKLLKRFHIQLLINNSNIFAQLVKVIGLWFPNILLWNLSKTVVSHLRLSNILVRSGMISYGTSSSFRMFCKFFRVMLLSMFLLHVCTSGYFLIWTWQNPEINETQWVRDSSSSFWFRHWPEHALEQL